MENTGGVQDGAVLAGETESSEVTSEVVESKEKPEPLSEERIADIVNKRVVELTGRMQSERDIAIKQTLKAKEESRFYRENLEKVRSKYSELDPDQRGILESEDLKNEVNLYRKRESDELTKQEQEAQAKVLWESIQQHLKDLGINEEDKRLDWAHDATDSVSARRRFDTSVSKILKEEGTKKERTLKDELRQTLKDEIAKTRKDLGLDSEDTSHSAGTTDDSKFLERFGSGAEPYTKENITRAQKLIDKEA